MSRRSRNSRTHGVRPARTGEMNTSRASAAEGLRELGCTPADPAEVARTVERAVRDLGAGTSASFAEVNAEQPRARVKVVPLGLEALRLLRENDRAGLTALRAAIIGTPQGFPVVETAGRFYFPWLPVSRGPAPRTLPESPTHQAAILGWFYDLQDGFRRFHDALQERTQRVRGESFAARFDAVNRGQPEPFRSTVAMRQASRGNFAEAARLELTAWFSVGRRRASAESRYARGDLNALLARARQAIGQNIGLGVYDDVEVLTRRVASGTSSRAAGRRAFREKVRALVAQPDSGDAATAQRLEAEVRRVALRAYRRHGQALREGLQARLRTA